MRFMFGVFCALLLFAQPAAAQHVYLHYLHFIIVDEHKPCADVKVELSDSHGRAQGTLYYRLQDTSVQPLGIAKTETLPKDLVPKVTVVATLGYHWHRQYGVCVSNGTVLRSVPWQTSTLREPDSLDLKPFKVIIKSDRVIITPEYR